MSEVYAVAIEGLGDLKSFENLSDDVLHVARMTVNKTARRALPASARSMERQVAFPRGYLTGKDGRLTISKFASDNDLEAKVTGRDKPTSLARFISGPVRLPGQGAARQKGVILKVKPNVATPMPSAFAIKLRNNNIGLAYRTRDGSRPNSAGAKQLAQGLYLLYGPSVDQVFVKTREMVRGDLEDFMEREFLRLLDMRP